MTKSEELLKRKQAAVPSGIANSTPIFAKKASGAVITDMEDNEYLDFFNLNHVQLITP